MIIHVVQPGETIYDIAKEYDVSVIRLIEENGIRNPENLVVGQTIVIAYPEEVYIAKEGDTLDSIAREFGITTMQLLRNNPFLSERDVIYRGESIIIRYKTQDSVSINAYAYPFIDRDMLKKTLPYLTYLTIFNYRVVGVGEIVGSDDTEVIQIAKDYGVAPLMSLSSLTYQGRSNIEAINRILYEDKTLDIHINSILSILREKGYYGLNISIVHLNQQNRPAYENLISQLSSRLKAEGYILMVTISPKVMISPNEIAIESIDYTAIGQAADYVQILSYGWGSSVGPPSATTPAYLTNMLIEDAVTMIPPEKLFSGISIIGYDWTSPYVIGVTKANALTTDAAIELALITGSTIMFEELSQAPYYEYYSTTAGTQVRHVVWFSDARTINTFMRFIPEYKIQGAGIWNIMNYFDQMWLVINSQYNINKVLPER